MKGLNLKSAAIVFAMIAMLAATSISPSVWAEPGEAAGPEATGIETVIITYSEPAVHLTMGVQVPIAAKLKLSAPVKLLYATGNPAIVKVNEAGVLMPVSPGATTLTISVSKLSVGYSGTIKLPVNVTKADHPVKLSFQPRLEVRKVKAGGRSFNVRTVSIPKGMPVTTGYANRKVGTTQPLASIADSYHADIAINGAFFDSYSGIPDPYGHFISNGLPQNIGNVGTSIGFKWDGSAIMETLRLGISGTVSAESGREMGWYVYFMNKLPPASKTTATMFTPHRDKTLGFAAENAIVVQQGIVTSIRHGVDVAIPADGFVLVFQGQEAGQAKRFEVGARVSYEVRTTNMSGEPVDWSGVHTAVGAGPRLVTDGKVTLDMVSEGFKDPKILTANAARSAIAICNDGSILLATASAATMKEWAEIMYQLGVKQAMNLDGGSSSGLIFQGKTVTAPGRLLSNALLFGEQLRY